MLLYTLLAFAAAPSVLAQKTISVMVGENGGLTYTPNSVTAQKGDIIQLSFLAKVSSITRLTRCDSSRALEPHLHPVVFQGSLHAPSKLEQRL
jgi:hypothetical protein